MYISAYEQNTGRSEFKCMQDGCNQVISNDILQTLMGSAYLKKILANRERDKLNKDPQTRWCPNQKCSRHHKMDEEDERRGYRKCVCGTVFCVKCARLHHPPKSCEEVLQSEFSDWAKGKEVQNCPKCNSRIEKISGCNHITCTFCQYEWCWLCRGQYTPNHFSSLSGCIGLGAGSHTMGNWPTWKLKLYKVGIVLAMILLIICVILLYPPAKVIQLSFCFYRKYILNLLPQGLTGWVRYIIHFTCFMAYFILTLPIFAVLMIIPGLCIMVYNAIRRRSSRLIFWYEF
eukprot:TRINITY_DN7754_c0_g1_i2.p1 TRINITY_DN7754_c0_g1~~TRINITY_DN7754_c0_g1_i2.p1  ORF type:complete len:288 (-),score=-10.90 TRINITY_DN7754_c0_g1_i2:168-1031(-)